MNQCMPSISDSFSTDHHTLQIEKPSLNILDELAPFIDEPIADSSILPSFLVSKLTRMHVKVALGEMVEMSYLEDINIIKTYLEMLHS